MNTAETMFEDIRWMLLVAVFLVSVLTVFVWLVQYTIGRWNAGAVAWVLPRNLKPQVLARGVWVSLRKLRFGRDAGARDSAGAKGVLSSLFSFRSFRENYARAWIRALNEQACRHGSSIQITFEDSLHLLPSASIRQVTCVDKSAHTMVLQCDCSVDMVTFPLTVTQQSPAAVSMDMYQVTIAPVQAQLMVCLEEVEEEGLLVSWSFSEQPQLSLSVTPCRVKQEGCEEKVDINMIEDLVENAIVNTHPAMMVNLKACMSDPTSPGKRQSLRRGSLAGGAPVQRILVRQLRASGLCRGGGQFGRLGELCCVLDLDPPTQEARSSFLPSPFRPGGELEWSEDMALDLDADTKELRVRLVERNSAGEKFLPGHASLPLDLLRRTPIGRQVLSVNTGPGIPPTATVAMELLFQEPGNIHRLCDDSQLRLPPNHAQKVEKEHNPMPQDEREIMAPSAQTQLYLDCRPSSPSCSPHRVELAERAREPCRNFSPPTGLKIPLSNGLDPVDDTAIRHLSMKRASSKRGNTIIAAGSKAPTAAEESACLIGCTASGLQGEHSPGPNNCDQSGSQKAGLQDSDDAVYSGNSERPSTDDVESETGSTGALETRSLKDHKVGFLRSGTKLLFRRKAQQKDSSLSRSHEDVSNMSQGSVTRKKSGSFSRRLIKRFSFRSRSKSKTSTSDNETPATAHE
ncbi:hypothetical protein AGOR_G00127100 [Albula goreensis]|uniref:Synaptotagmin-like mitochondrial and lipid-binding domain-containing protein n=1 Tax=Albula goreensis TaxID=1534307 RepID=A0A8T3DAG9_9TELE|nr:hypothetical protein AGOR_G00127100 [Albula goreensis]